MILEQIGVLLLTSLQKIEYKKNLSNKSVTEIIKRPELKGI